MKCGCGDLVVEDETGLCREVVSVCMWMRSFWYRKCMHVCEPGNLVRQVCVCSKGMFVDCETLIHYLSSSRHTERVRYPITRKTLPYNISHINP